MTVVQSGLLPKAGSWDSKSEYLSLESFSRRVKQDLEACSVRKIIRERLSPKMTDMFTFFPMTAEAK